MTITAVRTERPWTGRITTRSSATPPAKAAARVNAKAGQNEMPWSTNVQARNVAKVAISPWAKLITPVER